MDWRVRSNDYDHGPQHHSQTIQVDPNTHVRDAITVRRGLPSARAPLGAIQDVRRGLPSERAPLGAIPDRSADPLTQVNQGIRRSGFLEPLPQKAGKNVFSRDAMPMRSGQLSERAPLKPIEDRSKHPFTKVNIFNKPHSQMAGEHTETREAMSMESRQMQLAPPEPIHNRSPNPFPTVNNEGMREHEFCGSSFDKEDTSTLYREFLAMNNIQRSDRNPHGVIEDLYQSPVTKTSSDYIRDSGFHETPPQMTYPNTHVRDSIERSLPFFRATRKSKSIDNIPRNHFSNAKGQRMRDYDSCEKSKPMRALPSDDMAITKGLPSERVLHGAMEPDWETKLKRAATCGNHFCKPPCETSDIETHTHDFQAIKQILPSKPAPLECIKQANTKKEITKPKSQTVSDRSYVDVFSRKNLPNGDTVEDKNSLASIALAIQKEFISPNETFGDCQKYTSTTKVHNKNACEETRQSRTKDNEGILRILEKIRQNKISRPPMPDNIDDNTSVEEAHANDNETHASDKESTASNKDVEKSLGDNTMDGISSIRDEIWDWDTKISEAPKSDDIDDNASVESCEYDNESTESDKADDTLDDISSICDEIWESNISEAPLSNGIDDDTSVNKSHAYDKETINATDNESSESDKGVEKVLGDDTMDGISSIRDEIWDWETKISSAPMSDDIDDNMSVESCAYDNNEINASGKDSTESNQVFAKVIKTDAYKRIPTIYKESMKEHLASLKKAVRVRYLDQQCQMNPLSIRQWMRSIHMSKIPATSMSNYSIANTSVNKSHAYDNDHSNSSDKESSESDKDVENSLGDDTMDGISSIRDEIWDWDTKIPGAPMSDGIDNTSVEKSQAYDKQGTQTSGTDTTEGNKVAAKAIKTDTNDRIPSIFDESRQSKISGPTTSNESIVNTSVDEEYSYYFDGTNASSKESSGSNQVAAKVIKANAYEQIPSIYEESHQNKISSAPISDDIDDNMSVESGAYDNYKINASGNDPINSNKVAAKVIKSDAYERIHSSCEESRNSKIPETTMSNDSIVNTSVKKSHAYDNDHSNARDKESSSESDKDVEKSLGDGTMDGISSIRDEIWDWDTKISGAPMSDGIDDNTSVEKSQAYDKQGTQTSGTDTTEGNKVAGKAIKTDTNDRIPSIFEDSHQSKISGPTMSTESLVNTSVHEKYSYNFDGTNASSNESTGSNQIAAKVIKANAYEQTPSIYEESHQSKISSAPISDDIDDNMSMESGAYDNNEINASDKESTKSNQVASKVIKADADEQIPSIYEESHQRKISSDPISDDIDDNMSVESGAYDNYEMNASDKESTRSNQVAAKVIKADTKERIPSIYEESHQRKISSAPISDDIDDKMSVESGAYDNYEINASDKESTRSNQVAAKVIKADTNEQIPSIYEESGKSKISNAPISDDIDDNMSVESGAYDNYKINARGNDPTDSNKVAAKVIKSDAYERIHSICEESRLSKIPETTMSNESIVKTSVKKSHASDNDHSNASDKESSESDKDIEKSLGDDTMDGISSIRDEIWDWDTKISGATMSDDIDDKISVESGAYDNNEINASNKESTGSNQVAAKVIKADADEQIPSIYEESGKSKISNAPISDDIDDNMSVESGAYDNYEINASDKESTRSNQVAAKVIKADADEQIPSIYEESHQTKISSAPISDDIDDNMSVESGAYDNNEINASDKESTGSNQVAAKVIKADADEQIPSIYEESHQTKISSAPISDDIDDNMSVESGAYDNYKINASDKESTGSNQVAAKVIKADADEQIPSIYEESHQTKISSAPISDDIDDNMSVESGAYDNYKINASDKESTGSNQVAAKVIKADADEQIPSIYEESHQTKISSAPISDDIDDNMSVESGAYDNYKINASDKESTGSNQVAAKVIKADADEQIPSIYEESHQTKISSAPISDDIDDNMSVESGAYDNYKINASDKESTGSNQVAAKVIKADADEQIPSIYEESHQTKISSAPMSDDIDDNMSVESGAYDNNEINASDKESTGSNQVAAKVIKVQKYSAENGDDMITSTEEHIQGKLALESENSYMSDSKGINASMPVTHEGDNSFTNTPSHVAVIIGTQLQRSGKENASKEARICDQPENKPHINANGISKHVDKTPDVASWQTSNGASGDEIHEHKTAMSPLQERHDQESTYQRDVEVFKTINMYPTNHDLSRKAKKNEIFTDKQNHQSVSDAKETKSNTFAEQTNSESVACVKEVKIERFKDNTINESCAHANETRSNTFEEKTNSGSVEDVKVKIKRFTDKAIKKSYADAEETQSQKFTGKTNIRSVANVKIVKIVRFTDEAIKKSSADAKKPRSNMFTEKTNIRSIADEQEVKSKQFKGKTSHKRIVDAKETQSEILIEKSNIVNVTDAQEFKGENSTDTKKINNGIMSDAKDIPSETFSDKTNNENDTDAQKIRRKISKKKTINKSDTLSIQSNAVTDKTDNESVASVPVDLHKPLTNETRNDNETGSKSIKHKLFKNKTMSTTNADKELILLNGQSSIKTKRFTNKITNGTNANKETMLSAGQVPTKHGNVALAECNRGDGIQMQRIRAKEQSQETNNYMPRNETNNKYEKEKKTVEQVGQPQTRRIYANKDVQNSNKKVMTSTIQTQTDTLHNDRISWRGGYETNMHTNKVVNKKNESRTSNSFGNSKGASITDENETTKSKGTGVNMIMAVATLVDSVSNLMRPNCENNLPATFNNITFKQDETVNDNNQTTANASIHTLLSKMTNTRNMTTGGGPSTCAQTDNTTSTKKNIYRKAPTDAGMSSGRSIQMDCDEHGMDNLKYIMSPKPHHRSLDEQHNECAECDKLVREYEQCDGLRNRCRKGACGDRQQEDLTMKGYRKMHDDCPGTKIGKDIKPGIPVEPGHPRKVAWAENQTTLDTKRKGPATGRKHRIDAFPADDDDEETVTGCFCRRPRQAQHKQKRSNNKTRRESMVVRFIRRVRGYFG